VFACFGSFFPTCNCAIRPRTKKKKKNRRKARTARKKAAVTRTRPTALTPTKAHLSDRKLLTLLAVATQRETTTARCHLDYMRHPRHPLPSSSARKNPKSYFRIEGAACALPLRRMIRSCHWTPASKHTLNVNENGENVDGHVETGAYPQSCNSAIQAVCKCRNAAR